MISDKQKALEDVTKRLVDAVKEDFKKFGNPYDIEDRIWRLRNGQKVLS